MMFKFNDTKKVYIEHSPLLYKVNYMVYSAALGAVVMYTYIAGYGGTMPQPGSFYLFINDCWEWFTGPILLPILTAAYNHWRGKVKMKRRSTD